MSTFTGRWITTFGPMELTHEADRVHGTYWNQGVACELEGQAEDALSFAGEWRSDRMHDWSTWAGRRVRAEPGRIWLMVIEAHWQRTVMEGEYSFGGMLREFFARRPEIAVRQRFFNDEVSLQ